jgi:DNA-binding response OmpR family regulator
MRGLGTFRLTDPLGLTRQERLVIDVLADAGGWVSNRQLALELLGPWGGDEFGDATVRKHVSNARKKLGAGAIHHQPGLGYRLGELGEQQEGSVAS